MFESIDIELDRPRKMYLTLGALRAAERELNRGRAERVSIFAMVQAALEAATNNILDLNVDFIAVITWASLLKEDPALTLEMVEGLTVNPVYLTGKVLQCIRETFFGERTIAPAEEDGEAKGPLDRLAGSTSGASPESSLG